MTICQCRYYYYIYELEKTHYNMKTLNHILKSIIATAASAVFLYGCGNVATTPDNSFAEYIEAYTGGIVSSDNSIVIELAAPADGLQGNEAEINKAAADLFKFSPSVKGTARWNSAQRVEFIPEYGALKAGKTYKCTFKLGKVMSTDSAHEEFTFSFTTARKEAFLEKSSLEISMDDPGKATATGTLTLSESIDIENPEELLEFGWSGNATFEVKETGRQKYTFTASGLEREAQAKALTVKFKPGSTGFPACDNLYIDIPAAGIFSVMGAELSGDNRQSIDITFTEPLSKAQNLVGLVELSYTRTEYGSTDRYRLNFTSKVNDNILRLYYEPCDATTIELTVDGALRDMHGNTLGDRWTKVFNASNPKPEVSFPVDGNILPNTGQLTIPFKAAYLNAVDISIVKIYPNNILMFLQENDLKGNSGLRRAGRLVYKTTMRLDSDPSKDLTQQNIFTVGLDNLFKKEPGAIYRMRLSFKPEYYIYYKGDRSSSSGSLTSISAGSLTEEESAVWDVPDTYYYEGGDYDWNVYSWRDRNNPLTPSYYMNYSYPARNLMASGIGAIAKYSGGKQIWIAASDIISAEPMAGAEIKVYDFQLQNIGKGKSNGNGTASIDLSGKPFIVTVKKGDSITYLKVTDGSEKSLSRFDTGGETLQKGMKGFVYGERGVWRPGDTLHLTMILHGENKIPDTHPATIDVYTPQGQFFTRKVCRKSENGFYTFEIPTGQDSPTGLWNAYIKVGGAAFHKPLRIESIKPNRLKVNVNMGQGILRGGARINASISSNWLTGPAASGLQAKVSMTLKPGRQTFKGYDGFTFCDPASQFESYTTEIVSTRLNADGKASASITLPKAAQAPGMLTANILGSVLEEGGDESYTVMTMPFSPFSAYAGIKLPADGSYLETGKTHQIPVVTVDADGRKVSGHRLEWRIFKLKWSWWWESRSEALDSYINASAASAYSSGTVVSGNGETSISFSADDKDWGRYLIYVKDLESGHATGGIVYADWPAYRGRSDKNDPDAPAMLSFSTDKKKYQAGETATVFIPAAENGMALVSIEKGCNVLSGEWVKTSGSGETPYKIKITGDMAPNFYVHITLVQPYMNSANDLPLRMYGVQPVMVENPASRLEPQITMPDKLHPEEPFSIKISEKNGKPMTYTVAIVDEGLLDLTAFRTPDPWNFMFRREALGVKTWDMYDDVFGAAGGALSAMFSIGGDEGLVKGARKENRFNPIVKVLGPFTLKSGSKTHKITLPMYVGSVRAMVVAGNDGAYGNAEKTVPVTSPVMILPTLPRFAACGECITLPVNVFVMEDGIDNVNVSVSCEGPLSVEGQSTSTVTFNGKGDKMTRFALTAASYVPDGGSFAKVTVTADGKGHKMTETINIEVRNPSPLITSISETMLGKGESKTFDYNPFKTEGGRSAWIEASGYPSIGWNSLFSYMYSYRHSCTEQISARGISMINSMPMLSEDNAAKVKAMVPEMLTELYVRQLPDGGFAYWRGDTHADEWVTSMAGQFMTLARNAGYEVNKGVLDSWAKFQKRCIQNYRTAKVYALSDLTQAYRLFTMALAGNAEEAAMNRMKEGGNLSWQATAMLASTYAVCGKKTVGTELLNSIFNTQEEDGFNVPTYGTPLRNKAIVLEAMVRTGNILEAMTYATDINRGASGLEPWSMSTQESAFISGAMNQLAKNVTGGNVSVNVNEGEKTLDTKPSGNGIVNAVLNSEFGSVTVQNTSDGPAYVRMTVVSQAEPSASIPARATGIALNVRYIGADGSAISPTSIRQGTEFTAVIRVSNPDISEGIHNMALTEMIPSGWEIINERMTGEDIPSAGKYDYLDIRDDRNVFYFSIASGSYKEFRVRLRAAYEGKFVLPSVTCEAMYDSRVFACTASGVAEVTR